MIKKILLACCISTLVGCGGSSNSSSAPDTIPITDPSPEERISLPVRVINTLPNEISPDNMINLMGTGVNLGNTLDSPAEGTWALPAKEQYILDYKQAGFKHVRIPITWGNRLDTDAPYAVDTQFMDRVEEVVDWALDANLYVMINVHHDGWVKENYEQIEVKNRIDSLWIQIAERFKFKSAKLMFEILNEPGAMSIDDLNALNKRTLDIIRNETNNRLVIFAGHEWSPVDSLNLIDIPNINDEYLLANFHSYDPWQFAGQCTRGWGSESDKQQLEQVYQKASDWAQINNIPVMINEFGVAKYDHSAPSNKCNQQDREAYLAEHIELAYKYGIANTFWDDGASFSSYNRETGTWGPEKDILVKYNF